MRMATLVLPVASFELCVKECLQMLVDQTGVVQMDERMHERFDRTIES